MYDLIKELEVDVIGLLESDLQGIIMGNRDTTRFLAEDLGMNDVEPADWDRWCEYILFGYARVSRSTITDMELQVAKFVVPASDEEKQRYSATLSFTM